jgi:hypothetical protein
MPDDTRPPETPETPPASAPPANRVAEPSDPSHAARQEEQTGSRRIAQENQGKAGYPGLATSASTEGMEPSPLADDSKPEA